jgi:ubiquinone/menaquinone biosynthesis C-methylase UbiE
MSAREYFERAAAGWDETVGDAGLATLRDVLVSLNLPDDADVLDWGAGTGLLLPIIAELIGPHGSIVALDASAAMLHQAMSRCPIQDVRFVVADAAHTGLPSASFDAVLCIRAFPHFPDKAAALREAARLLRADGLVAIVHAASRDEVNAGHARMDAAVAHDTLPPQAEMQTLLRKAGFVAISVRDEPGRYVARGRKAP